MSRVAKEDTSREYRGMKRSTRMSLIAGVAVFLTLVSGVSFAAWTASSTKTATATAGTIAVSTATSAGAATITALGPFTYTSTNQTVAKPISVRNTGSVAATLSSITMTRTGTGTLPGSQILVTFWVGASSACAPATPTVSARLDASTPVSLTPLGITIAAAPSSAILCASTKFTGSMTTYAGQTTTAVFAVNTTAGTLWTATDSVAPTSRTFTQSVSTAPSAPSDIECTTHNNNKRATVSWNAPAGFGTPNGGYKVYFNGVFNQATDNTTVTLEEPGVTAQVTIRAVASDGSESVDSAAVSIIPTDKGNGGSVCG
jgi:hypothetical protein